jgi:hypothetical protein
MRRIGAHCKLIWKGLEHWKFHWLMEAGISNHVWTLEKIVGLLWNMGFRGKKRIKRSLSPHQKQIRFFTVLCSVIVIPVTVLIFWLLSR